MAAVVSGMGVLPGCNCQASPYPQVRVTTPLGKQGECSFCKKKFDPVEKDNMVTIQGVRYILCNEKCAAGMEEWIKRQ